MIEISGVSKRYGDATVVDDVSLTIPGRGVTAIIGPNGAGKSTLLSLIARLLPMTSGRIAVDGLDIARTRSDALARRLAILRQDNHVAARLRVDELVSLGRYPHSKGRLTTEDRRHIDGAIAFLGLERQAHRFLHELSGGQRQRAFVAMVLCQDTDYLLLDEPLNNLDMKHATAMMKLLRRAADTFGKSIVIVLHDINYAAHYADRIVAMRDGRVLREGTPDETIREEVLLELYDEPVKVREIDGARFAMYYF